MKKSRNPLVEDILLEFWTILVIFFYLRKYLYTPFFLISKKLSQKYVFDRFGDGTVSKLQSKKQ